MKALHDIHYEYQMKSQLYKFTDTSLFINFKEYPYKDLKVLGFHEGNRLTNSWYTLETSSGKKLIVGYKPKDKDIDAALKPIFEYIAAFDERSAAAYHERHREFQFIVDSDTAEGCRERLSETVLAYIRSDKRFVLADHVFDGELQMDDTDPKQARIEVYMYDLAGSPVFIGYIPEDRLPEMAPFLEEGTVYELRMLGFGYGIGKKKYAMRALLVFDRRREK